MKERNENLEKERDALEDYSRNLMRHNKEMEEELENFVNADDSVCRKIRDRDDRLSPLRSAI